MSYSFTQLLFHRVAGIPMVKFDVTVAVFLQIKRIRLQLLEDFCRVGEGPKFLFPVARGALGWRSALDVASDYWSAACYP